VNKVEIMQGDVLDFACNYDGEPFHALLCDPPYHITSIVKRFQNGEPEHTKTAQDIKHRRTPHARQAAGFMNQKWDGGDIAFRPETWVAFASCLYPGAFLFAFAGTRGYHRMAVAMEDAGLILHPLLIWIFGSGFPKATRVPDERFAEHRYGLQALKPSLECIAVAQVPYRGSARDCITKTGAGAFNIGAGRIGGGAKKWESPRGGIWKTDSDAIATLIDNPNGRWPANLLLDEDSAVVMDQQSGILHTHSTGRTAPGEHDSIGIFGVGKGGTMHPYSGSSGGASRFFFRSDWQAEECDPFFYCAKAGRVEREAGLDALPLQERDVVREIDRKDGRGVVPVNAQIQPARNIHPTVKPLRLTRYLASLLLPPAEYGPRRLFVPFAGVASECIGASLAGWESVVGVEGEEEYCEIGRQRVKFWQGNVNLFESLTATDEDESEPQQLGMEI
jgi:site-specific DNA-methyltransferase (adenine-specific)